MEISSYVHIPDYPQQYTANAIIGRMLDTIGFRYYWATEGLTEDDLSYRPCSDGRSIYDTLQHVYNILEMASTTVTELRYELPESNKDMHFDELRQETLRIISQISTRFKEMPEEAMSDMSIKFKMGDQNLDFPLWNVVNGPITDVIYHVGQVVGYRRASGNPMQSGINLFTGQGVAEVA